MIRLLLTTLITCILCVSFSQDFSYGKISKEDFEKGNLAPQAEAIVLHEYGKARIEYNSIKNN